jgi:hypothetical protein
MQIEEVVRVAWMKVAIGLEAILAKLQASWMKLGDWVWAMNVVCNYYDVGE